jgi:hypothetical protein
MKRQLWLPAILFCLASSAFAGRDPADYPLRAQLLQQSWTSRDLVRGEYRAAGRGNLWEGETVHAFDFAYDCAVALTTSTANHAYPAKWRRQGERLDLLGSRIGKNDKYEECELKITMTSGVYVVGTGDGILELTQQNYRDLIAKQKAARSAQPAPTAVSKLSIVSAPEGAEIEIDGAFVGNVPSVLEMSPGEHTVTVRKSGFKTWEKKVKLVAGEIKVSAEMEAEK